MKYNRKYTEKKKGMRKGKKREEQIKGARG
jgi:hypothetical protein